MLFNTYPYNPFPASTDKLDEAHNEQIQTEIEHLNNDLNNLDNEINGDAVTYPYAPSITINNAVPANLVGCVVKIEPVQSGSGDPSPENVRPITGHTQAIVTVADDAESPTITKNYTIDLGSTIYGGTVDFDTGVMTVDRVSVDMGTLTWETRSSYGNKVLYASSSLTNRKVSADVAMLCEKYKYNGTIGFAPNVQTAGIGVYAYYISSDPTRVSIYCITTDDDAVSGNMVYELATPFTVQLTHQQIQILKGTNTLTASTGDISVTVNRVNGAIGSVQEQANDTNEALAGLVADIAEQLPTAPTTDGDYVLTVTVADGTPTYSWESAE